MIITITLNSCIDRSLLVSDFQVGKTFLAEDVKLCAAGKGINVSRVLDCMGLASKALVVTGKDTASFFESSFEGSLISPHIISHSGITRINTTIVSPKAKETHIREAGTALPSSTWQEVADFLENSVHEGDLVAFCGSLPLSTDLSIWKNLLSLAKKKHAFVLVDTSKQALVAALETKISAITVNLEEFCFLTKSQQFEMDSIAFEAQKEVQKRDMKWITVTFADKGAVLVEKNSILKHKAYNIELTSSVGAGDAFVAGMLFGMHQNIDKAKTLAIATACGAAACEKAIAGSISLNRVEYFLGYSVLPSKFISL